MNVDKIIKRFEQELFVVTRMTDDQPPDMDHADPAFVDGYWYGRRVSIEDALRNLAEVED